MCMFCTPAVVLALEPQGSVSGQPALERCVQHSFCRSWCFRLCTPLESRQEAWYFRFNHAIITMFQCSVPLKLEPVCEGEVRERGQGDNGQLRAFFPSVTQPTPAANHMSSLLHLLALDTCYHRIHQRQRATRQRGLSTRTSHHSPRATGRQADKQTSRQADKQTSRQADKQTGRQAGLHAHRRAGARRYKGTKAHRHTSIKASTHPLPAPMHAGKPHHHANT
jgi:hypothetical protein